MADLSGIVLPTGIGRAAGDSREAKRLEGYLYQLTEQLQYVLSNLDSDNMSQGYNAAIAGQSARLTALQDTQTRQTGALQRQLLAQGEDLTRSLADSVTALEERWNRLETRTPAPPEDCPLTDITARAVRWGRVVLYRAEGTLPAAAPAAADLPAAQPLACPLPALPADWVSPGAPALFQVWQGDTLCPWTLTPEGALTARLAPDGAAEIRVQGITLR